MNPKPQSTPPDLSPDRIAQLEARIARLEARIGLESLPVPAAAASLPVPPPPIPAARTEEELEFQVGQNWFARIGIGVLALGAGITLSLPFAGLPAFAPSLAGYGLAAGLYVLAQRWRPVRDLAAYLRGVALALLWFATLRLGCFASPAAVDFRTPAGGAVLALATAVNLVLAWRRPSPWLVGLALLGGAASAVAVGTAAFMLPAVVVLALLAAAASARGRWPGLWLGALPAVQLTYVIWAINDPFLGRPFQFLTVPAAGPAFALAATLILGIVPLAWRDRDEEDGVMKAGALVNCALGFGVYLVGTLAGDAANFATAHVAAAAVFLGLAVCFRLRFAGPVIPFLYAMTGNFALTLAIVKAAPVPAVFVWLSVQSVLVAAAAVWFRSRFLVVANFLIYVFIVVGYVVVAARETGISLGFGLVALLSARLLHWQKDRLELKTELMRNAYLLGAFVVFPYALLHLVPAGTVGFAWVGLALFYYLLNLIVRSPKFRWMGHATLLLTTGYLLLAGTSRLEPVYRVLSFLVLGTVLLVVSLLFTRLRRRAGPR